MTQSEVSETATDMRGFHLRDHFPAAGIAASGPVKGKGGFDSEMTGVNTSRLWSSVFTRRVTGLRKSLDGVMTRVDTDLACQANGTRGCRRTSKSCLLGPPKSARVDTGPVRALLRRLMRACCAGSRSETLLVASITGECENEDVLLS